MNTTVKEQSTTDSYLQFRKLFSRHANDTNSEILLSHFLNVMSLVYNENEVSAIALTEMFNVLDENGTGVIYIDDFLNPNNSTFAEHIQLIEQNIQASAMNGTKITINGENVTYEYTDNEDADTDSDIRNLVNQSSVQQLKNMVHNCFHPNH